MRLREQPPEPAGASLASNDPAARRVEVPIVLHVLSGLADAVAAPGPAALQLPVAFALHGGGPNPFRGSTEIRFDLPRPAEVDLRVFDVGGRLVRNVIAGPLPAGRHGVQWDGRDNSGVRASSGVYFCRLRTDGFAATRRLLRLD